MLEKLDESRLKQTLDWTYDKVVNGAGKLPPVSGFAEQYLQKGKSVDASAKSLIRWQKAKAGASGFLTGLGGVITLPVTIPISLANVLYVQLRMIAAIAYMGGHDLTDDRIQTLIYMCLLGNSAKELLKDTGILIGKKLTTQAIKNISGKSLTAINRKVGFRLLTKFGEKGAINLGKSVPFVGGAIGGTVDVLSTQAIGVIAYRTFIVSSEDEIEIKLL